MIRVCTRHRLPPGNRRLRPPLRGGSATGDRQAETVRVVRLANYVAPASGGLRTALRELGAGYLAAGHDPVLIVPGPEPGRRYDEQGLVVTVPGHRIPALGGYRAITERRSLRRLLESLEPDRLEVSDRTTLRWTGAWARARGVRSMMVSHDSLAGLMKMFGPPVVPVSRIADRLNRASAASYDVIACTTAWAAAEFRRLGTPNLVQVPLGVDLSCFHPRHRDESLRSGLAPAGGALLIHCSRLSPEKRPERALGALAELLRRGVPAVLVIAGDGPLLGWLQRRAGDLPVRFLRHVADRGMLARLLAAADVAIAPGPVETFGLSAMEALASGTPVVVSSRSALPELIGKAGLAADDDDVSCADSVQALLGRDPAARRAAARAQAERYAWPAAVDGFLAAHGLDRLRPGLAAAKRGVPAVRAGLSVIGAHAPGFEVA
jgi:alpha-1,6-mannosyltransferase